MEEMRDFFLIFAIGLFGFLAAPEISAKEVSNADIQSAIVSLIRSFNLFENKLERHENRERALGDVIKRALQALQKGQKVYEPIKGIFTRLDERVSQIETMLIAQEEKYNAQTEKLTDTIQDMYKWMNTNAACGKSSSGGSNDQQTKLIEKIDMLSENVDQLAKSSQGLLDKTDKMMDSKLSSTEEVISKMEDKLSHFYVTGPISTPSPMACPDSESKVINYLDKIYDKIGDIKSYQKADSKLAPLDKDFLEGLNNCTQKSIADLKQEFATASARAMTQMSENFKELTDQLSTDIAKTPTNTSDSKCVSDDFCADVNKSISALHDKLEDFNKFDKVLLATSDYVLDTQRKVEYGTHQIIGKVGDLIKSQNTDLNNAIQKRFDDVDEAIITNHKEALQNLSSIMELEIGHVWRQIEIMHGEIAYSKDALEKLQDQTESYVNGTISTMDSMGGKVAQITGRMSEVDENLNYLLGRLSLVTQEFNQIKTGLGSALDQIRSSFQTVQDKIKDVGPGPHPIPGDAEAK